MSVVSKEPVCIGLADEEQPDLLAELVRAVHELLEPWRTRLEGLGAEPERVCAASARLAAADLLAITRRDPATKGSWGYVLEAYSCFHAVMAYRLAHTILMSATREPDRALVLARSISERAKVATGVEIHPAATIGPRLIIDHGIGTVIGEDVVIGSDSYILQGVVLGARGIADNVTGRRHPWLGDRVQIGGFARVLGPVTVGDDVVIGCHALVRSDVPAGSQVSVLYQYQVVAGPHPVTVYGAETLGQLQFRLHGTGLDRRGLEIELLDASHAPVPADDLTIVERNATFITVEVSPRSRGARSVVHLRIRQDDSAVTVGIPISGHHRVQPLWTV